MNHYLLDSMVCFVNSYPLDSDLSGGYHYPTFQHLGPGDACERIQIMVKRFLKSLMMKKSVCKVGKV